jgi:hypothetical protein
LLGWFWVSLTISNLRSGPPFYMTDQGLSVSITLKFIECSEKPLSLAPLLFMLA